MYNTRVFNFFSKKTTRQMSLSEIYGYMCIWGFVCTDISGYVYIWIGAVRDIWIRVYRDVYVQIYTDMCIYAPTHIHTYPHLHISIHILSGYMLRMISLYTYYSAVKQ